jgi:selenocysteine lyase/cysteine desulfurase
MSTMGLGFLYTSERIASAMTPYKTGWLSVEEPWDLFRYRQNWRSLPGHLETGTPNMIGIAALGEALQTFYDIGTESIQSHILYLTGYIINRLENKAGIELISPVNSGERAGIVSFRAGHISGPDAAVENLKKKNVTISAREGLFRLSPHFYNTVEEIDRVIDEFI